MSPLSYLSAAPRGKVVATSGYILMTQHAAKPRFSFITETITELKKVVWLTRRELVYLTTLVLIVTVVATVVLGAVDYGFSRLVDAVLLGR